MTSSYSSPALANSSVLLSPGRVLLLASGAGFSVATLYYSQPILGVLGAEIQASEGAVGMVPMLTQLGYALGILLLAPLGDRYDRRGIILAKAVLLMLALLLGSIAPGVGTLLAASLVIGLAATLAQDIVPAAATLAPESQRGRVVGTVMTGLLLGILLSRVMSGLIAEQLGCFRRDGDRRGTGQLGAWTMGLEWRGRAGGPGIHRRTGGASCATGCTLTATELGRCHEMRAATCICGISSQAARLNWSPEYCELSLKRKRPAFLRAFNRGAGTRSRTRDLLITSQLLYQLSYTGI